jgi:hypothetical protein
MMKVVLFEILKELQELDVFKDRRQKNDLKKIVYLVYHHMDY